MPFQTLEYGCLENDSMRRGRGLRTPLDSHESPASRLTPDGRRLRRINPLDTVRGSLRLGGLTENRVAVVDGPHAPRTGAALHEAPGSGQNKLAGSEQMVVGHELDWLALSCLRGIRKEAKCTGTPPRRETPDKWYFRLSGTVASASH